MTKSERMFKLVALWRESGLSRDQFSQKHNLKRGMFSYWIAKEEQSKAEGVEGFTRLDPPSIDSGYEITYPNGVKLHVKNASLSTLSLLLKL